MYRSRPSTYKTVKEGLPYNYNYSDFLRCFVNKLKNIGISHYELVKFIIDVILYFVGYHEETYVYNKYLRRIRYYVSN